MDKKAAVFLDRDGVIMENRANYVRCWGDVAFFPEALVALRRLRDAPYLFVLVTNQSVVGRGIIPLEVADGINEGVREAVTAAGGRLDGIFMCPHAPADDCDCRKPQPGLLLRAAQALHIDLSRSVMIGDALTDVAAGQAAGVAHSVLLLTGRGRVQAALPAAATLQPFATYSDLAEALAALEVG